MNYAMEIIKVVVLVEDGKRRIMEESLVGLNKVEVVEDIQINGQEIVRKGAIGSIDYNIIY